MGANRTILLDGLRKSDEMVFSSLLTLLASKTRNNWVLISEGIGDVTVVDIDTPRGQLLADALEKKGNKVIRLTNRSESRKGDGLWLHKPVRSSDILKCLTVIDQTSANPSTKAGTGNSATKNTNGSQHSVQIVRLFRWPSKEIIKAYPGSSRLCALLFRHAISLEKAAALSGLPYDTVLQFVNECKKGNYIKVSAINTEKTTQTLRQSSTKHTNLFSKLRQKFAIRN